MLDLSRGPTFAFKDIALQLLGNLFEYALDKRGGHLNIVGATSGDTGSAAEYAMLGKERIRVFMLSPKEGMSKFQRAQMYALNEPNIFNLGSNSVFDDCQDIVKAVNADAPFKSEWKIGAVNSINWARIAAQIVYYFKGYLDLMRGNDVGKEVEFAIPTGNYGNIHAGEIAMRMGLPINRLILATNENNVLERAFRRGEYRPWQKNDVKQTSSPSMDIANGSNYERHVFLMTDQDGAATAAFYRQLAADGFFNLKRSPYWVNDRNSGIVAGSANEKQRRNAILEMYNGKIRGRLIDPHTANAVVVGTRLREPRYPLIVLETAKSIKFAEYMGDTFGIVPEGYRDMKGLMNQKQRYIPIGQGDTEGVKAVIREHGLK